MSATHGELRLTLPVPPSGLWPNARMHWAAKGRLVAGFRAVAMWAALSARRHGQKFEMWTEAETRVVFYFATNRRRDRDNAAAALKAAWDGIADAGVIANDSGLVHFPPEMRVDRDRPRVEIEIRRALAG